MITTVIGAYPKPNYLKITDWFNAKGGTDNPNPTKFYTKEIKKMGDKVEELFFKAAKEIIDDQIDCGIYIITDGEIRRENYIHYHFRQINIFITYHKISIPLHYELTSSILESLQK